MAANHPSRPKPPPPASAAPNGPRVFISHSSKNQPLAAAVLADLEGNGIRCWMAPRDIRPGEPNYGKAIIEGLSACQAMVLLLTERSNRSQHVMKEAERAVNKNIPILVVKLQPIDVSKELEYYVSSAQFLDATAPPARQHLGTVRHRVRDMLALANREPSASDVVINLNSIPMSKRPRWKVGLAGVAVSAFMCWGGWSFGIPTVRAFLANLPAAVQRRPDQSGLVTAHETREEPVSQSAQLTSDLGRYEASDEPPAPEPASRSMLAGVEAKDKVNSALAAFVSSRLANFHRESLLVTKGGPLATGKVSDVDVEIIAFCRIPPKMSEYLSLSQELIGLLERVALRQWSFQSDGLHTSNAQGRDARQHLAEIREDAPTYNSGSLARSIFVSDMHARSIAERHFENASSDLLGFPSIFLLYDERLSEDDVAGFGHKMAGDLLGRKTMVILNATDSSMRHTSWRFFQLATHDWEAFIPGLPEHFKCVFSLIDSSGSNVEREYYPLEYGYVPSVAQVRNVVVDKGSVRIMAPFFVSRDFRYYIPEITLAKPIVVLRGDVPRIKDFKVSIEEIAGND